ncbi:MAG TPA: sulfurtransferase [Chloroflexota bacterium]|nr:sulfurtransferase [Chloroflexota bacterium]
MNIEPARRTTDWLQANLRDPRVVVVDVRPPHFFRQGHIPGAHNLPDILLPYRSDGRPDPEGFCTKLGAVGVTPDSRVVLYDDGAAPSAARLFWALAYLGHQIAALLDGGMTVWLREGRPFETEASDAFPADYGPSAVDTAVWAGTEDVLGAIGDPNAIILDVRSPAEYLGLRALGARNGHIPTALNLEWTENLVADETGAMRLRSLAALREFYVQSGALPDKNVIVYCASGVRSSHTFAVLKMLGYPSVANYTAGWQEWGNRADTPVEQ